MFTGDNYNDYTKIKKTIQINLNNYKINKNNIKEVYYLKTEEGKKLSERIEIWMIDMVKAKEKCYNENKLARWCSIITSTNKKELKKVIGDDLMEEKTKEKLVNEIEKYTTDDEVIELYSMYSKDELEKNTLISEAKEEGINQGYNQSKIEVAQNMLNEKMDIELISKITNLSNEEILSLMK